MESQNIMFWNLNQWSLPSGPGCELFLNASLCADEELSTLKGIEGETSEDKPPQQVNLSKHLMRISSPNICTNSRNKYDFIILLNRPVNLYVTHTIDFRGQLPVNFLN